MHLAPVTGLVVRIERGAVHDGPGLRTVVFLQGCPLRCGWCHSPETQSMGPQPLLFGDRCIGCGACVVACPTGAARLLDGQTCVDRSACESCGACAEICPTGARQLSSRRYSAGELLAEVARDRVFFDQSGGGITLSGGEPLLQADFAVALLDGCRRQRIHTAVETCGLAEPAALLAAAGRADLILFDIKAIDAERHRRLTGTSNERILDNLRALAALRTDIVVRYPLLPGLNDDEDSLSALGRFAAAEGLRRVDLLPYHRAGIAKYERLGRSYGLADMPVPDADAVARAEAALRNYGIHPTAGGLS
jgi:pyruvate formate lyase activating enzyme